MPHAPAKKVSFAKVETFSVIYAPSRALAPVVQTSANLSRPALQHLFDPPDRLVFGLQATGETVGFDAGQKSLEERSGLQLKEFDQVISGQKRWCVFAGQEFGEITSQQTLRKAIECLLLMPDFAGSTGSIGCSVNKKVRCFVTAHHKKAVDRFVGQSFASVSLEQQKRPSVFSSDEIDVMRLTVGQFNPSADCFHGLAVNGGSL
jgi:hypothetical protein